MKRLIVSLTRKSTAPIVYRKSLPREFGSAKLAITPRSDLRLIYPGYHKAAFDLMLVARNYIKPGNCVWDIGSNLGIFAACAAYKAGRDGRVYALEADPRYVSIQNKSFEDLSPNYAPTSALCAAAAERDGLARFAVSKQGHARSHLDGITGQVCDLTERFQDVVCLTLDSLLEHWRAPDFIKLDVEGAEELALLGAKRILEKIRPKFYIEVSDQNGEAVTTIFREAGYRLFKLEGDGRESPLQTGGLYTIAKPCNARNGCRNSLGRRAPSSMTLRRKYLT